MDDALADQLRARWQAELERVATGDSWVERSLAPVVAAAASDPDLGALFPFTSLNRLCFSRCSTYPYTFDCPCIAVHRGGYAVLSAWAVGDEPAPVLAETDDAAEAVSIAVAHLPDDRTVWLGTAE